MRLDEVPQKIGRDERRVARQDEHVVRSAVEHGVRAANRIAGSERPLLDRDLRVSEGIGARRRGDDDHGLDAGSGRGGEDPVHDPTPH
jgi:hypothetical protein